MRFIAVVLGALAVAGPAYADTSFQDTVGENPAAADISTISVSNDATAQTVTFKVQITNMPAIEDNAAVEIYLDGDNNGSTGKDGIDCVVGIQKDGWYVLKWDGAQFSQVTGLGLAESYDNGLWTSTMHVSDCTLASTFGFWLSSFRGPDPTNPVTDEAPDGSTLYSYTQTAAAPAATPTVEGTSVTVSAPPRAGKTFTVTAFSVVLTDGTSVDLSSTTCSATLGGAKLRGTGRGGCRFAVPKKARGKKLVVHVSGKAANVIVRKTVTYRVR